MRSSTAVCGPRRRVPAPAVGVLLLALVLLLGMATTARADMPTLPADASDVWSFSIAQQEFATGTPATPMEGLMSQIASAYLGHTVTLACQTYTPGGSVYDSIEGQINSSFFNGQLTVLPRALMSGSTCEYLQKFAQASEKPTNCPVTQYTQQTVLVSRRVAVRSKKFVHGKKRTVTRFVIKKLAVQRTVATPGPLGPCYLGGGKWAGPEPADYDAYATIILALAHETMHLNGDVGIVSNGVQYGEADWEAEAQCHGLQAMAQFAVGLGDSPVDAQSLSMYAWDQIYPRDKAFLGGKYWSADCVPGGRLDTRPPGTTIWP